MIEVYILYENWSSKSFKKEYIVFKPRIYSTQSSDLDGFDTGFSEEIVFGYRFNPNIAADFGIGYFNTEGEETVGGGNLLGREFDIDVHPRFPNF